ncbi:MAG TPA: P-loop NTPase fold protein [Allosphingosinicella sp.]|nr:P-loop NTPase fold protein [Allosphingosinicella sp.]
MDPNRHIREYLNYYLGFQQSPRYAVLLSGPWGSGKTYQAQKIVSDLLTANSTPSQSSWLRRWSTPRQAKRYVLVSLYGLRTPQEIDDAMVAALYPWTTDDGIRIAASVGKAVLKHAKIDLPELKAGDLINRMSAHVFIFDDLERCRMAVTDALGYINQLVERDGCKVVVLANEAELAGQEEYRRGKEKLIGKTLVVEPDFDAAFTEFLIGITDLGTRNLYAQLKPEIRAVYDQSTFRNLRILQQTLWDFERVYRALDEKHRANQSAMAHLMRLFFALSFEQKAGTIETDDLENRTQRSLIDSMGNDENPRPLMRAGAKYPGLYLYDSILSDEVMSNLLVRGFVDAEALKASLDKSSWFISADEPAWRTVWHAYERPEADVEAAAKKMLEEFAARRYTITGEVLHLFGQMLVLSDIGFSGWDRARTVSECKAYIDDLRTSAQLERPVDAIADTIRHGSYGGLGFSENSTPEFGELWTYLKEQRAEAAIDRYPEQARTLTAGMSNDPAAFVRQIAHGRDGEAPFAYVPVLAALDPDEFADQLIALDPLAFREILLGLSSRYDMGTLARQLAGERLWAESLESSLRKKAHGLGPIGRERITKNVQWTLGKKLAELREAEAQQAAVSDVAT